MRMQVGIQGCGRCGGYVEQDDDRELVCIMCGRGVGWAGARLRPGPDAEEPRLSLPRRSTRR